MVLLVLVGYSGGTVVGAGGRRPRPSGADLLGAVALAVAALQIRTGVGRWTAFLLAIPPAVLVGAVAGAVRRPGWDPGKRTGPGVPADATRGEPVVGRWRRFALRMGGFQGRLTMWIFFFTVVAPFAVVVRLFRNLLRDGDGFDDSFWARREPADAELDQGQ